MSETPSDQLYLRALMDNLADSIYFKDRACRLLNVSRKMALDLGFSDPGQIVGKTDVELFGEEFGRRTLLDDRRVMDTGEAIIGLIESRRLENGSLNWTSTTKLPLRNEEGDIIGLMGITREINDLIQMKMDLQYLATHDALTGLPNRYLMFDRLQQVLARASRYGSIFAVLYADLDKFKPINDNYGHDFGDLVLQLVARRLRESVRECDTVARLGGDEFVIILDSLSHRDDAAVVAEKILLELEKPFNLHGKEVQINVSIGISLYPDHGEQPETLIRAADNAMYQAKRKPENRYALFSAE